MSGYQDPSSSSLFEDAINMALSQLSKKDSIPLDREYAEDLDKKDSLRHLRAEFIIPTKGDLKNKTLRKSST